MVFGCDCGEVLCEFLGSELFEGLYLLLLVLYLLVVLLDFVFVLVDVLLKFEGLFLQLLV